MGKICRFSFVEGITSGTEDGTDSLPHLTNVKPDPEGPASKPAAGETQYMGACMNHWTLPTVPAFIDQAYSLQHSPGCCASNSTLVLPAKSVSMGHALADPLLLTVTVAAEREPQAADEGGQLQLQLLDADKSEPQPLGLESGFQEYLR